MIFMLTDINQGKEGNWEKGHERKQQYGAWNRKRKGKKIENRRTKHNNSVIITKQNTESTEGIFMSGIVCNKRGNKKQVKQKVKWLHKKMLGIRMQTW